MAKPKNNKQTNETEIKYNDPRDAFLSTKKEMVVLETDMPATLFFKNVSDKDLIVIAEDSKGYYITCKNIVNQPVLDPYRQYKRISAIKTETGFNIKNNNDIVYSVSINYIN